jgi:HAD superfamily hydrolase (TIGR01450 family)
VFDFSPYSAVLLDLDGTLYHEEHALPGAADLVRRLKDEHRLFACLSNSTASPVQITMRLARMGIDIDPDNIYTAAAATADYVVKNFGGVHAASQDPTTDEPPVTANRRARVFNLATEGIHEMLNDHVDWVRTGGEPCDAVIVGTPTNVYATDDRQRIALQLLRNGAHLLGICADRVYPSPRGIEFGSGALSWMLGYAANVRPIFCGKPETVFFTELCHRLQVDPSKCILIGDNIEADIAGGKAMSMATIMTLTGVTRRRDLLKLPEEKKPGWVVEDLTEL